MKRSILVLLLSNLVFAFGHLVAANNDDLQYDSDLRRALEFSLLENKLIKDAQKKQEQKKECLVCFDDVDVSSFPVLDCKHSTVCIDCLRDQVASAFKDKLTEKLKCSTVDCESLFSETDIIKILNDQKQLDMYYDITLKEYIAQNNSDIKYCPTPDCGYAFAVAGQRTVVQCPECKYEYCSHCSFKHSFDHTCDQAKKYRQSSGSIDAKDLATQKWIAANAAQCTFCATIIQKNAGCNHMTCKSCKNEFCYKCKRNYTYGVYGFEADCHCPLYG